MSAKSRTFPAAVQRHYDESEMWAEEERRNEAKTKEEYDEDQILRDVETYGNQGQRDADIQIEADPKLTGAEYRQLQHDLGMSSALDEDRQPNYQDLSGSFGVNRSFKGLLQQPSRLSGTYVRENSLGARGYSNRQISQASLDGGAGDMPTGNFVIRPFDVEELRHQNAQAMKKLPGSEAIISKVLAMLDCDPSDDLLGWPANSVCSQNKDVRLSESKMLNEVAQRQPQIATAAGKLTKFPLCSTTLGWHSTNQKWRASILGDSLGEATHLYFKFLKYFIFVFFLCSLLSAPALAIYASGRQFDKMISFEWIQPFWKAIALSSMGNLEQKEYVSCVSADLPRSAYAATSISFECQDGWTLSSLLAFGLADKEQACSGSGLETRVQTVASCSLGGMTEAQTQWDLQQRFEEQCEGRADCSMSFKVSTVFDRPCQGEIQRRQTNTSWKQKKGPARVYALASCQAANVRLGSSLEVPRDKAAVIVVCLDCLAMLVFSVSIIRLRWYEKVSVLDMKKGKLKIEDFTITIPSVPIKKHQYGNSPEILKAQLAVHFEQVLKDQPQCIPELEEIQDHETEVNSIYFGLSSFNSMRHLVKIFKECEQVANLKKKIQIDPKNVHRYETEMWRHYTNITNFNTQYLEEKGSIVPEIKNVYVTFRSMEGRERALRAFDLSYVERKCTFCCCWRQHKPKKLLGSEIPKCQQSVDPGIIIWENFGVTWPSRCRYYFKTIFVMSLILIISFLGHAHFENIEEDWLHIAVGACQQGSRDQEQARLDALLPLKQRVGALTCYCEELYAQRSLSGLAVVFSDGKEHCMDWYYQWIQSKLSVPALGVLIAVGNMLITVVFSWLGITKRSKDSTATYGAVMKTIFLCQYVNTAVLILVAHHRFRSNPTQRPDDSIASYLTGTFDEFDNRWYMKVGSSLIISQCVMVFMPHIFTILHSLLLFSRRCLDRSCSCSTRKTRQLIQDDYEDLYTGPAFVLHVRYAQVLSTIFTTLTFSSGMPVLYILGMLTLLLQYGVDKCLVFNYYRKTPDFTKELSQSAVSLLPWAAGFHFLLGIVMYSAPLLWTSTTIPWFGISNGKYFTSSRLGQLHLVIFFILMCFHLLLFLFEKSITRAWRCCYGTFANTFAAKVAKCRGRPHLPPPDQLDGFTVSDDVLKEINYGQLYKQYLQTKDEMKTYRYMRQRNQFTDEQLDQCINPYLDILERNLTETYSRLMAMAQTQLDVSQDDVSLSADEQKMQLCYGIYYDATDVNNPARDGSELKEGLIGKVANEVQSYDYLDNKKYKRIERLIEILEEDFGFDPSDVRQPPQKPPPAGSNPGAQDETEYEPELELAVMHSAPAEVAPIEIQEPADDSNDGNNALEAIVSHYDDADDLKPKLANSTRSASQKTLLSHTNAISKGQTNVPKNRRGTQK